jgi:hypothetical protein
VWGVPVGGDRRRDRLVPAVLAKRAAGEVRPEEEPDPAVRHIISRGLVGAAPEIRSAECNEQFRSTHLQVSSYGFRIVYRWRCKGGIRTINS